MGMSLLNYMIDDEYRFELQRNYYTNLAFTF